MRRLKKPTCRKYISRSSPAFWPPERMAISISLPCPRMSSSVSSSSSRFSWSISRSSCSCTRGSSGPSAFLRPSPRASRSRKYRLKIRSKVSWSRASLTRVVASVALNVSRSVRPTSALAASASSASAVEIRTSARRRSPMNSRIRSSNLRGGFRQHFVEGALHAVEVLLVLHEHRERGLDEGRVELPGVEDHQGAGPVDRLRHRRRLAQIQRPDLLDGGHHRAGQPLGGLGHLEPDDVQLVGRGRKIDEQVQAAPLETIAQLTGVVRGEHDERDVP